MSAPVLNLSPEQFAAAFPFHIAFDERLRVLQAGSVLRRLCPDLIEGSALGEHFIVQRPVLQRMDYDAIRQHEKSLFVLQRRAGPMRLACRHLMRHRVLR